MEKTLAPKYLCVQPICLQSAALNSIIIYMSQMLYAGQSARQIVTFLSDF